MKRVTYLVVAALVSVVVVAPTAAAQGEQLQQALQDAQTRVQEAQQYMQSPEGQTALADAQASLQTAVDNARENLQSADVQQQLEQAREQAQARVDQAQQYMDSPEGQAALADARTSLEQAGQQLQQVREGAQEKMQEVTSKMERTALVKSGGPGVGSLGALGALAAPAAALLVGGAILGYAVLRRR